MARKANVTYRSTPLTGVVFEVAGDLHIRIPQDGTASILSFRVDVWLSQTAKDAGEKAIVVPEWESNAVTWNPTGAAPLVQAYAFVAAKLAAAGATNIVEV